jgi:acyl carrier protein
MAQLTEFEQEIAQLIVESLNLTVSSESIDAEEPLFSEGLGLDSIDALELSLAISQKYGLEIKSADQNIKQIFLSLKNLSKHIQENK